LSPGTSLTCACAQVLSDLSPDFSHRSVLFFAAGCGGRGVLPAARLSRREHDCDAEL